MSYQADNMAFNDAMDYLEHHGVLGMKWGVRNEDTLRKYAGPKGVKERTTPQKIMTGAGYGLAGIGTLFGVAGATPQAMLLNIPASVLIEAGNPNHSKKTKAMAVGATSLMSLGAGVILNEAARGVNNHTSSLLEVPYAKIAEMIHNPKDVSGSIQEISNYFRLKNENPTIYSWLPKVEVPNVILGEDIAKVGTGVAAVAGASALRDRYKRYKKEAEASRNYVDGYRDGKNDAESGKIESSNNEAFRNAAEAYLKEHPDTKYTKAELISKFENGWGQ